MFSFLIGKGNRDSKLLIGGYDEEYFNLTNLTWHDIKQDKLWWAVNLDSIYLGEEKLEITTKQAIVDTGSSYILAPLDEFLMMVLPYVQKFNCGFYPELSGLFACTCSSS